jgi:GTPase SAR1 family protein
MTAPPTPLGLKLVVIGPAQSGKTQLIRRFCLGPSGFTTSYIETIGVDVGIHPVHLPSLGLADNGDGDRLGSDVEAGPTVHLHLWDMAGPEVYADVRRQLYDDVDGILLVYDASDANSVHQLERWVVELEECARLRGEEERRLIPPGVVVANKIDLRGHSYVSVSPSPQSGVTDGHPSLSPVKTATPRTKRRGQAFATHHGLAWIATSAKSGLGVEEAFATVIARAVSESNRATRLERDAAEEALERF